ncbi:MAG TPA: dihydrolipoyl dehydrogenase [Ktedonobacterales bacterium]|nr:dihydrolipoyl dehydrogenase [Ktedonobacterales bacterium]
MATGQTEFDVLVIGAGVGGYPAAIRAAQLGARVGIVEKQYIGGTCLNVGCIPSKALLHVAHLYAAFDEMGQMGIEANKPKIDMGIAVAYKDKVVKQLTGGVGQLLKANGVTVFEGTAEMQSPTQVRVTLKDGSTQDLRTSKLILANGSKAARPPFPGIDGRNVIFSDDAMTLSAVPSSLVCIGGGVIAVELACMLNAFGTEVTIVEMLPAIIANEDEETRNALARSLTKRGVKIVTGAKVESIEDANGKKRVTATTSDGSKATFDGEYVLVAVGRQANPVGLDALVKAGLKMERGCVVVNEKMETSLPGVYAIGDLVGRTWLAHVAETEGEVAGENATGHEAQMDYNVIPRPIFTFPEIASVGLSEQQARERNANIKVGKFPWAANGKALTANEAEGFTKVIIGEYGEILGATIFGPDATNLITEYSLAMRAELTVDEIIATVHPHPTYSEALREAALAAEGRPIHIYQRTAATARR